MSHHHRQNYVPPREINERRARLTRRFFAVILIIAFATKFGAERI